MCLMSMLISVSPAKLLWSVRMIGLSLVLLLPPAHSCLLLLPWLFGLLLSLSVCGLMLPYLYPISIFIYYWGREMYLLG